MTIEEQWWETFHLFGLEFEKYAPHYERMNEKTRVLGCLMKLELDMHNGGFVQFFCNWGYPAYLLAIDGLEQLKAFESKELLLKSYSIIDKYKYSDKIERLWDILKLLSDDDCCDLDKLDECYWENQDRVMERMLDYYLLNSESFKKFAVDEVKDV